MILHKREQSSLLTSLVMLAMLSVLLIIPAHGVLTFLAQKEQLITAMQRQLDDSLSRLSENATPFMASFAVHEYQKLLQTEISQRTYSAILVTDLNMADILGRPQFTTGLVRTAEGHVLPFDPADQAHQQILAGSYLEARTELRRADGSPLGTLSIHMADTPLREKQQEMFRKVLLDSFLLALTLIASLVVFFKWRILAPLKRFSAALEQRDVDGMPVRELPGFRYRELTDLAGTLNGMLNLIRHSREALQAERSRLGYFIDGTQTGTWEWNTQTGEVKFNERWAEMIGYTLAELEPLSIETWTGFVHPDDLAASEKQLQLHFSGLTPFYQVEARMRHKDGHWVWVLDKGKVIVRDDAGNPLMMYGTHQDVSEQKENEFRLRIASRVFEHVTESIIVLDGQGVIQSVNPAFTHAMGYLAEEAIGKDSSLLHSDAGNSSCHEALCAAIAADGDWSGEVWIRRKSGEAFPAHLKISEIDAADAKGAQHYVALLSDISLFKKHEHELQQLAHFDALTGLPNRIILADRLQNAMAMATRHQRVLAVAFLDLDGFKAVNDTYGHDVGDLLLIQTADRLGGLLRESDTLVRLGGDEFVVLLPDLNEPESCRMVIQRLLQTLSSPVDIRNHRIQVSASIGVAFYPQGVPMDAEQLLRQADQAMYEAKMAGKNQCRYAAVQTTDERQPLAG